MGDRAGQPLRFGILSAANIANVFAAAVAGLPDATIVAVAARNLEKAALFAAQYDIPVSCSYDELIANAEVDAVYVPLPTGLATGWAVKAAKVGKHVLVDKPFDSAEGVRAIVDACTDSSVAFLDGTHFVHSNRMRLVRQALAAQDPKTGGYVRHVDSSFTFPVALDDPNAIRANTALEPAGALGDVGWYNMRAIVSLLGVKACRNVVAANCSVTMHSKLPGVIVTACGFVRFASGQSATFDCGFLGSARQRFEAVTECGSVIVRDFVLPIGSTGEFSSLVPDDGKHELGIDIEKTRTANESGELELAWPTSSRMEAPEEFTQAQSMVNSFIRIVGKESERKFWMEETEVTQQLLDMMYADAMEKEAKSGKN